LSRPVSAVTRSFALNYQNLPVPIANVYGLLVEKERHLVVWSGLGASMLTLRICTRPESSSSSSAGSLHDRQAGVVAATSPAQANRQPPSEAAGEDGDPLRARRSELI
jgi:hypothetical protein